MKKKTFKLQLVPLSLGIIFCLLLMISSCSPQQQGRSLVNLTERAEITQTGRKIRHAMGETVVSKKPKRVVVLTNEGTDMLIALGVKPIGAVKSWQGDPFYDYIDAKLASVVVVGDEFQPNLEKIIALKPDLIIGSKVRQKQVYQQLAAIAPTVFSETLGGTWKENLQLYAQALNQEEKATALLAAWDQKVATLKEKLGANPPTVSLLRFLPGTAKIYYQKSFPGQIVAEVGLLRPEIQRKDSFADGVGLESIQNIEADYLFYFTHNEKDNKGTETQIQWFRHPLWTKLKVVQNQNVYEVSDAEWTSSSGILAANQVLDDLSKHLLK
ncbi:iron-siderophore ABC transporter substrate-binding protein (plasmid) [Pseudanabaena biceps]|nr:iron-siderophore ABC transporter substrate-binding protein [Pseudanabaena biceps]